MSERIDAFPPILGEDPRVLILGSMPSVQSLCRGEYYGNPRNHFWPLLYRILAQEGPPSSYVERVEFLKTHGIAVWDVIANCIRKGSLDQNIDEASYRDIGGLLEKLPAVSLVALNGTRAERGFREALQSYGWPIGRREKSPLMISQGREVEVRRLPSTSPIPTRYAKRMEDKITAWSILADHARLHDGVGEGL